MEIGKVVEIGERNIEVTPTKREESKPRPAPEVSPEREREHEPA